MIKAVLFDLDDTLFDYRHCRRCGLFALQSAVPALSDIPVEELEKEHEILLEGNYMRFLNNTVSLEDAILERTHLLFSKFGMSIQKDEAVHYTEIYQSAYRAGRRAVPNAVVLIEALKSFARIGVVSNGIYDIQIEKIEICGVEPLLDFLILSEEVKSRKPDRVIFEAALEKAGCAPGEAVFIGDNWESDIAGALGCGIHAIWLNRYGKTPPAGGKAYEIRSFDDIEGILGIIRGL